eukprot:m.13919 g.13919  ORF g.13919 m.13919 type:complete len:313 (+) comp6307_c0_seq1:35-973(+)
MAKLLLTCLGAPPTTYPPQYILGSDPKVGSAVFFLRAPLPDLKREIAHLSKSFPTAFIIVFQDASAQLRAEYFELGANMVGAVDEDVQLALVRVAAQFQTPGKLSCPYCPLQLTAEQLWWHVPLYHIESTRKHGMCPICNVSQRVIQVHIHDSHVPPGQHKEDQTGLPLHAFSIVVCRRPADGKFLMVQEFASEGFWFPGGRMDPGETFAMAAIRECQEEAGVKIVLKGVLGVEHTVHAGYRRARVFYLAEPAPDARPAKTIPDYESAGAVWVALHELASIPLRSTEPNDWFARVDQGCHVAPLEFIHEAAF